MQAKMRKVQFYLDANHYGQEFKQTDTILDIEEYIKHKPQFIHSLQQNGKDRVPADAQLIFRYNSMQSQPSLKTLRLNQFHPTKRIVFYIEAKLKNSPSNNNLDPTNPSSLSNTSGKVIQENFLGSGGINIPLATSIKINPDQIQITIHFKESNINVGPKPYNRNSDTIKSVFVGTESYHPAGFQYRITFLPNLKNKTFSFDDSLNCKIREIFGEHPTGYIEVQKVYVAGEN